MGTSSFYKLVGSHPGEARRPPLSLANRRACCAISEKLVVRGFDFFFGSFMTAAWVHHHVSSIIIV